MIIWSDKVLVGHRLIEAAISVQDGLIKVSSRGHVLRM